MTKEVEKTENEIDHKSVEKSGYATQHGAEVR